MSVSGRANAGGGTGQDITNVVGRVDIRRATVADAEAIAQVRIDSWRASYRGIIPDAFLDGMKTDESVQMWTRVLSAGSDAACTFVAEIDGELVGFAAGITLATPKLAFDAELTALYILPSAQRAGIGQRLLAAAGAPNMLVWVLAKNSKARAFVEHLAAVLVAEQTFKWDELDLIEVAYGWHAIGAIGKTDSIIS